MDDELLTIIYFLLLFLSSSETTKRISLSYDLIALMWNNITERP